MKLQNSGGRSVPNKRKPRGNPEKIEPFKWQPGQSGNPNGRPKKGRLEDILRHVLGEKVPKELDPHQRSLAEVLIRNWVIEGIKTKDTQIINEIFNRVDGKVKDRIALSGDEGGEPIKIERVDMKNLTDEELQEYERLVQKTRTPRSDE
jgi:hypothetical protein